MTAEQIYRLSARAFPATWRRSNEDDLIATLLDIHAAQASPQVSAREAINLIVSGLTMRVRQFRRSLRSAPGQPQPASRLGLVLMLALTVGLAFWLRSVGGVSSEFLLTSLVVVLVPGTGVIYTVSNALGGGRRNGFLAAVGCTLGIVPHMAAAMFGLSGVMQAGAAAFEVVRWAGVAYLAFMGLSMLRGGGGAIVVDEADRNTPALTLVRRGVLLNLLNPKLTVFFFAFLPQFLDSPPTLFDLRLVGLGAIFMAMTLAVFIGYAYAGATVRERVLAAPAIMRWVQRAFGTLLIGFAARLAVTD